MVVYRAGSAPAHGIAERHAVPGVSVDSGFYSLLHSSSAISSIIFHQHRLVWRLRSPRLLKGKVYVANASRHNVRGRITAGHRQHCASAGRRTSRCQRHVQGRQLLDQCHKKRSLPRSQGGEDLVQPVNRRYRKHGRASGCRGTGSSTGSRCGCGAGQAGQQGSFDRIQHGSAGWWPGAGVGQQEQQGLSLLDGPLVRQNQERRLHVGGRRQGAGLSPGSRQGLSIDCVSEGGGRTPPVPGRAAGKGAGIFCRHRV